MWNGKFVVSISGNGECGKDTAAMYISQLLRIPYKQSTSACVVDPWWNEIQNGLWSAGYRNKPDGMDGLIIEKDFYKSKEEFHNDRRNRRMDWVSYIEYFNLVNSKFGIGLYEKSVEDGNQILTGIRRTGQFNRCLEHIIDVSVWMNRPGADIDESQEYDSDMCDYTLENDGTLDDLKNSCIELCADILKDQNHKNFTKIWIYDHLLESVAP